MNRQTLKEYLQVVSSEGYAVTNGVTNDDGSKMISNEKGLWSMKDTYYGGEPYGGNEIIFYEGKPVWMMIYYGLVSPETTNVDEIYDLLKKSLAKGDPDFPLRGPRLFIGQGMQYTNHWDGDIEKFEGKERILVNGREIYSATYMGGWVNKRDE